MLFRTLAALHILAVVAFFSNFVAALFWKIRADRSADPAIVAHTFRTLDASDLWITPISTVVITATGFGLALVARLPLLGTGWILWSIGLFAGSGVVFLLAVFPLQRAISRWTSAASGSVFDWPRYRRDSRRWATYAHLSLGLAVAALLLMILKPALPGL